MDRTHCCIARKPQPASARTTCCAGLASAALLLLALATHCRADSAQQHGARAGTGVSASAHLDFRVVVLPSVALSMQANGWGAQGNSGVLTVQRSVAKAPDSRLPRASVPMPTVAGGELITIAAP